MRGGVTPLAEGARHLGEALVVRDELLVGERGQPLRRAHRERLEAVVRRRRAQAGDAAGRVGAEGRAEEVGVVVEDGAGVVAAAEVLVHDPPVEQAAADHELRRGVALALRHVRRGRPREQPPHRRADRGADLPAELGALLEARVRVVGAEDEQQPERGRRQLKRLQRQLQRHQAGVVDAALRVEADEAREGEEPEQDGEDAPRGDAEQHAQQQPVVSARRAVLRPPLKVKRGRALSLLKQPELVYLHLLLGDEHDGQLDHRRRAFQLDLGQKLAELVAQTIAEAKQTLRDPFARSRNVRLAPPTPSWSGDDVRGPGETYACCEVHADVH